MLSVDGVHPRASDVCVAPVTDRFVGGVGGVVSGGVDDPCPLSCSTSRYVPYPEAVAQLVAPSTGVPSPHSLKVVTSWKGAFDAIMSRTFWPHRVKSRARRGAASSAL